MIRKSKLRFIILSLLSLLLYGCSGPEPASMEFEDIDTSQEPFQTPYDSNEIITMEIKDGLFEIKPLARYKASVMVWWKSSLTRNDTGDNSCELFYVTKVRIGNNVYQ
jgi:hypothetical protein